VIKNIPNILTLFNLTCGLLSIVFSIEDYPALAGLSILAACIFDFLDGMAARILKAVSDIGKQLDSLADLVSFGVAPFFILYFMMKSALSVSIAESPENIKITEYLYLASPMLVPVFAAIRLARFNVRDSNKQDFSGLATPASAIFFASLPILVWAYEGNWYGMSYFLMHTKEILLGMIVVISFLMVSNLPMISLKFKNLSFKENWSRYVFAGHAIGFAIFLTWRAIPSIIVFYILFSITLWIINLIRRKKAVKE